MLKITDAVKNVTQSKGRPLGKNTNDKAYCKTTFSLTAQEKKQLTDYANKHFKGNISMCIKEALKKQSSYQKIYLAGPDVFLPNAKEHGKYLKKLCKAYGFEGAFPLDNIITGQNTLEIATKIRDANKAMIAQCDIVIANLSPFRGPEPDSGTIWEVGFAEGLGKEVLCYSSDLRTLKEKTQCILGLGNSDIDLEGMAIEDFGLTHNLMFAHLVVSDTFEGCLHHLKANKPS